MCNVAKLKDPRSLKTANGVVNDNSNARNNSTYLKRGEGRSASNIDINN